MYINFLNDRRELGFPCKKDVCVGNQILNLKMTVKNNKIFILLFWKKLLISVIIYTISKYNISNKDSYSSLPEVYQSYIIKSNNSNFVMLEKNFNSFIPPSTLTNSILTLSGGWEDDFTFPNLDKSNRTEIDAMKRLAKSILSKSCESLNTETSINKKLLKLLDSVISDEQLHEQFWKLLQVAAQPIKSDFVGHHNVQSTDIFGTATNPIAKKPLIRIRKGSGTFVEAFSIIQTRKRPPLIMTQTSNKGSYNELTPFGLSLNHDTLLPDIQNKENITRFRRTEPLYFSEVLGESFKYSQPQLEMKGFKHLEKDFKISISGKTMPEIALEYKTCIENLLRQPDLVIRKDGTMNRQEPTINYGDPNSQRIVSFENNLLYRDKYFITAYELSPKAFEMYTLNGNIGLSPSERRDKASNVAELKQNQQLNKENSVAFFNSLPKDARMSKKQFYVAKELHHRLENGNLILNDSDANLMKRFRKYNQQKREYFKMSPNISDDEF